jgi:integrase/recombinase XerD
MTFERMIQELKIRRNSPRTIEVYLNYNKAFLKFIRKLHTQIERQDVRNYLEHLANKKRSGATMRLAFNALLFYYRTVLQRNIMYGIIIPKRDQKVTVALTKEEVSALLISITNPKHKLLIELIYGSGLRASEAVKVKWKDVFLDEKLVVVRSGKGKKDRKTILSNKFVNNVIERNPDEYVFMGRNGHLTTRSVQEILKKAAKKAGLKKHVYPHLLRHSFATHLDEAEVKTRHLKKLLGHKDVKTTNNYIYDSGKELKNIKSPGD